MDTAMEIEQERCEMSLSRTTDNTLLVELLGSWKIGQLLPLADDVQNQVESGPRIERITFNTDALT